MDQIALSRDSDECLQLLLTGCYQQKTGWVANKVSDGLVYFQLHSKDKPSALYRWFKAIRPISLTATAMPALAVIFICLLAGLQVNWPVLIPALIAMLLLQVSVNVFNDVEDYLKLIDLPDSLGGSGVIQCAWLTTKQMGRGAWLSFIGAILLSLPALWTSPEIILICAFLGGLGVLGYSGKPFAFKYRAMGDVLVFILCGPALTVGVSLAATSEIAPLSILLGLYFGFLACTILNANNINDINVDTQSNAVTLASLLGFKHAVWYQLTLYLGVIISLLYLSLKSQFVMLLPLFALPLIVLHLLQLFRADNCDHESLHEVRFVAAKLHLLMSVLLSLALMITWLWS